MAIAESILLPRLKHNIAKELLSDKFRECFIDAIDVPANDQVQPLSCGTVVRASVL